MNDAKFIEDLKNSPYYERLFRGHNVISIYIAGSRLAGIIDERSDYDLVILTTDEQSFLGATECLTYNDIKVHWYYVSVYQVISNNYKILPYGQILYLNSNNLLIIYVNENYKGLLQLFEDNKQKLLRAQYYLLYYNFKSLIETIILKGKLDEEDYTKHLYQLCVVSYYVCNEPLYINFLKSLKRIRWQPVSDEYKTLAIERIRKYKQFVDSNYDEDKIQEEIEELNYHWLNSIRKF